MLSDPLTMVVFFFAEYTGHCLLSSTCSCWGYFYLTSVMVHDAFRQGESVFGFDLDRVGKAVLN
jgi:hypothetical protein